MLFEQVLFVHAFGRCAFHFSHFVHMATSIKLSPS